VISSIIRMMEHDYSGQQRAKMMMKSKDNDEEER